MFGYYSNKNDIHEDIGMRLNLIFGIITTVSFVSPLKSNNVMINVYIHTTVILAFISSGSET
jgi:hypothetical protein